MHASLLNLWDIRVKTFNIKNKGMEAWYVESEAIRHPAEIKNTKYLFLSSYRYGRQHSNIDVHIITTSNLYDMFCKKNGLKKIRDALIKFIAGVDLSTLNPIIAQQIEATIAEII